MKAWIQTIAKNLHPLRNTQFCWIRATVSVLCNLLQRHMAALYHRSCSWHYMAPQLITILPLCKKSNTILHLLPEAHSCPPRDKITRPSSIHPRFINRLQFHEHDLNLTNPVTRADEQFTVIMLPTETHTQLKYLIHVFVKLKLKRDNRLMHRLRAGFISQIEQISNHFDSWQLVTSCQVSSSIFFWTFSSSRLSSNYYIIFYSISLSLHDI